MSRKTSNHPIASSPAVLGGEPVFAGTRVPVKNLIDYLEAGDSLDDFLEAFPSVTREQAIAALEAAEGILEEARRPAHLRTKRETVIAGVEELIRKSKREGLRSLAGQIRLDVDVPGSRERRRT